MKRIKLYSILALAVATLGNVACGGNDTQKSAESAPQSTYDGPEVVESQEPIIGNPYNASHIVISKAALTLKLYDTSNRLICSFPVAAGTEYGNKQEIGDRKTPEGEFKVGIVQETTEWLDGEFGDHLIRIDVPDISSFGICGTKDNSLVGKRSSAGNILMRSGDLDSLLTMVHSDMTVSITPANKDLRADGKAIESSIAEQKASSAESAESSTSKTKESATKESKREEKRAVEATTDSNGDVWHTIAKGEYISTIAAKYDISIATIKRLNPGINVDRIREGQRIKVYGAESASTTTTRTETPKSEAVGEVWHTVKQGEYLSVIAGDYNTSVSAIKRLNPDINVDRIREGQRIRVK